jgi:hypothetical protein
MSEMLFEEVEVLVIGDELSWDPIGHGEVGVDHLERVRKIIQDVDEDQTEGD